MKNLKGFLTNTIAILVGILIYVFMSQPYFNIFIDSIIGSGSTEGITGYGIIGNYFESSEAKDVILALCCLIVSILAGLLILLGIFNLLTSTGVVKVKNAKITNIINIFVSIFLVVLLLITVCIIATTKESGDLGSTGISVAWALIVNFILSFVALGTTLIASIGSGKKAKKKKK